MKSPDDSKHDPIQQQLMRIRYPQIPANLLDRLLDEIPSDNDRTSPADYKMVTFRWNKLIGVIAVSSIAILVTTAFVLLFRNTNHSTEPIVESITDLKANQQFTLATYETDPQFILPPTRSVFVRPHSLAIGNDESVRRLPIQDKRGNGPEMWRSISIPRDGLTFSRTTDNSYESQHSLAIYNTHRYENTASNNWCFEVHGIQPGSRIRLRAAVRTENATIANVCVQSWSDDQTMIGYCSTPLLRGSHDWTEVVSGNLTIPANSDRITVRAALTGIGQAWFDSLSLIESNPEGGRSIRNSSRRSWQSDDIDASVVKWIEQMGTANDLHFEALNRLIDLGEKSIEPLRIILNDENEALIRRWQSAMILSNVKSRAAIPELFAILEQGNREDDILHGVIVESFFNYRDEEIVQQLKLLAEKEETRPEIRETINQVLQDPTFYPFPNEATESEDSRREWELADRQWALALADRELEDFDPSISVWIRQIGTSRDFNFAAFHKLSELGQDAEEPLLRVLCSRNQPLIRRWQSAMILSDRRCRKAIPDMIAILRQMNSDEETLQHVLIECLLKYEDDEIARQLDAFATHSQTPDSIKERVKRQLLERGNNSFRD